MAPFVKQMFPGFIDGEHLTLLIEHLEALEAGAIKRLIVTMPPRHGKSELCSIHFPAWYLGRHPDNQVISASYSGGLSFHFSVKMRHMMAKALFRDIFGYGLNPRVRGRGSIAMEGFMGGVTAAGVGSGITGRGADLFVIDDPVKDAKEAYSSRIRDHLWEWYTTTAYTRLMPDARMLVIGTRWHPDDLIGRLLAQNDKHEADVWTVLHMPAIDDRDGGIPDEDGQALWPARYPLDELLRIKASVGEWVFEALYQGRPTLHEGNTFRREWLTKMLDVAPADALRVRYWDKAATQGGDYSSGLLMGRTASGLIFVEDVLRGRWEPHERNAIVRQKAEFDRLRYGSGMPLWIEQEGGSGGKESAMISTAELAGFNIHTETVSGSKLVRALPFAAQCGAGNVYLVRGPWNEEYVEELCAFPNGANDDMVDTSSGAFNKLMSMTQGMSFSDLGGGRDTTRNMWGDAPTPFSFGFGGRR